MISSAKRKVFSYRLDTIVGQEFKENCRKLGQSTCHIIESFEYGFNKSMEKAKGPVLYTLPQINLNMTVVRQVSKYRRRTRDPPMSEEEYLRELEFFKAKQKADREYFENYKKEKLRKFWRSFDKNPFE